MLSTNLLMDARTSLRTEVGHEVRRARGGVRRPRARLPAAGDRDADPDRTPTPRCAAASSSTCIQADNDPAAARDNARFANDFLAEVVARHPTRFQRVRRAADAGPGRRGRGAGPRGDPARVPRRPRQRPHARALPRRPGLRRAVEHLGAAGGAFYLHPGSIPADDWHVLDGRPEPYGASWSWQAETGGHALRLVYAGVFDRHPNATVILGHLGEFLPLQKSRLDSRYRTLRVEAPLAHPPSTYIGRNILLTTSGVLGPRGGRGRRAHRRRGRGDVLYRLPVRGHRRRGRLRREGEPELRGQGEGRPPQRRGVLRLPQEA